MILYYGMRVNDILGQNILWGILPAVRRYILSVCRGFSFNKIKKIELSEEK